MPDEPKGGWRKAVSPSSWFSKSVTIYLICAHGLHIVKCGPKGKGYRVKLQKDWVKKWAPIFAISLFVLKAALASGRVVGIPMPHVPALPRLESISPGMANALQIAEAQMGGVDEMLDDLKEAAGEAAMPTQLSASLKRAVTSAVVGGHAPIDSAMEMPAEPCVIKVHASTVFDY